MSPHLPTVTVGEHHNPDHLILWMVRGAARFVLDGVARTVVAGNALWVPAGVRHGFTTDENSVLLPLSFPTAATATTLREVTLLRVERDLRTLFLAYLQATTTIIRPPVDIARQVLALIETAPPVPADLPMPSSRPARAVADALCRNPADDRSIVALAATVHASPRTVERAFLAETGTTLRRWRIGLRMQTAAVLLRSPTSVGAVAARVGYTNVNAFRRVFKDHLGLPPGQYADRFRAAP